MKTSTQPSPHGRPFPVLDLATDAAALYQTCWSPSTDAGARRFYVCLTRSAHVPSTFITDGFRVRRRRNGHIAAALVDNTSARQVHRFAGRIEFLRAWLQWRFANRIPRAPEDRYERSTPVNRELTYRAAPPRPRRTTREDPGRRREG